MKSNIKVPMNIFNEFIQIFRTAFLEDQRVSDVLCYNDKGSGFSKIHACTFVNKAILAEDCLFPGQKKYRSVENFYDPNMLKYLGSPCFYSSTLPGGWTATKRTFVSNGISRTFIAFIVSCQRFVKELKEQNEPCFVSFGLWLEKEYDFLKNGNFI